MRQWSIKSITWSSNSEEAYCTLKISSNKDCLNFLKQFILICGFAVYGWLTWPSLSSSRKTSLTKTAVWWAVCKAPWTGLWTCSSSYWWSACPTLKLSQSSLSYPSYLFASVIVALHIIPGKREDIYYPTAGGRLPEYDRRDGVWVTKDRQAITLICFYNINLYTLGMKIFGYDGALTCDIV